MREVGLTSRSRAGMLGWRLKDRGSNLHEFCRVEGVDLQNLRKRLSQRMRIKKAGRAGCLKDRGSSSLHEFCRVEGVDLQNLKQRLSRRMRMRIKKAGMAGWLWTIFLIYFTSSGTSLCMPLSYLLTLRRCLK
ncbi:hypothetical protein VPH35_111267 [Triticum aestivum]